MSATDIAFSENGALSRQAGYHKRDGQIEMAHAVEESFVTKDNLVIEAGTGTGKTYGYLVPIIMNKKKAIISTDSIALQDQLIEKDVKNLRNLLGIDVTIDILKGMNNYVCLKNLRTILANGPIDLEKEGVSAKRQTGSRYRITNEEGEILKDFLLENKRGEIQELQNYYDTTNTHSSLENALRANNLHCVGRKKCNCGADCFFYKARELAKQTDILIINHALLCCGVSADSEMFPEVDIVVIDEAHKLPERVKSAFSLEFGLSNYAELVREIRENVYDRIEDSDENNQSVIDNPEKNKKGKGKPKHRYPQEIEELDDLLMRTEELMDELLESINNRYTENFKLKNEYVEAAKDPNNSLDITVHLETDVDRESDFVTSIDVDALCEVVKKLCAMLSSVVGKMEKLKGRNEDKDAAIQSLISQIKNTQAFLDEFLPEMNGEMFNAENYYRWYEKSTDNFMFRKTPLNPAREFRTHFLNSENFEKANFVFTSATIATTFSKNSKSNVEKVAPYMSSLGISVDDTKVLLIDSPFQYDQHGLICIPKDMVTKFNQTKNISTNDMIEMMAPSIAKNIGGTLILTTSASAVEFAYKKIKSIPALSNKNVYIQNKNTNKNQLLQDFKNDGQGILIGTKSFWEGVDIVGSALTLVIIDKLPFPQRSIELIAERRHYLDNNPNAGQYGVFMAVDLPKAIIDLKQGVGRLIRSETDMGVVVICAPSLLDGKTNKRYSKMIMDALPRFMHTEQLDHIDLFLDYINKKM